MAYRQSSSKPTITMPPRHEVSSAVSTRHHSLSSQEASLKYSGDHDDDDGVRISANDDDDGDDDFGEFENAANPNINANPNTAANAPPSPDIYAALDQLEISLDAELEDLTKLGYLKTSFELESSEGIDSSSAILIDDDAQLNHDGHEMTDGDVDNSMNSGEEEEEDSNSKEERMMLLPPPPSWFQLDNQYMAPVTGNGRKHDCHNDNSTTIGNETRRTIESTKSGRKDVTAIYDTSIQQTDKSPSISRATVDSIESKNINATADSSIPTILQSNSFDNENINMFNLIHSSSTPPSQSTSLSTATTTLTKSLESILHHSTQTLSQTIPTLLHEYSSSAIQRSVHKLRLEYARLGPTKRYARASDIGNACGRGYYLPPSFRNEFFCNDVDGEDGGVVGAGVAGGVAARKNGRSRDVHLDWMWASDGTEVRFTTLPWIERQLVHEWRTYEWSSDADLK